MVSAFLHGMRLLKEVVWRLQAHSLHMCEQMCASDHLHNGASECVTQIDLQLLTAQICELESFTHHSAPSRCFSHRLEGSDCSSRHSFIATAPVSCSNKLAPQSKPSCIEAPKGRVFLRCWWLALLHCKRQDNQLCSSAAPDKEHRQSCSCCCLVIADHASAVDQPRSGAKP